jgi:two-component system sensor histidine kinase/response regulator
MLTINLIIGEPRKFSLEERIFNTFCSISTVVLFLEIFFNWFIGLNEVALICFIASAISAFLYYQARIKRKTKLAIRCMGIFANFTFFLNYFFNSGISGPNLLLFALVLLITNVIVPRKELWIWIVVNICTVFAVTIFEYYNADKVPYVYKNDLTKTIDFLITYLVAACLICFAIYFIRTSYEVERDIVSQKNEEIEVQAKQILAQNIDLEKLNSEKAKLFSIVAHDIRSPLSSILGFLEVLSLCNVSPEENERVTKALFNVTKDTSGMLANVLAWSKAQMQGARVEITAINLKHELTRDLALEQGVAEKKNINLVLNNIHDIYIAADLNMFLIVVRNLVSNAIKFTNEGGLVTVSTQVNAETCDIIITDNGLGVDEKQQANLFELKAQSTFGTNNEKGVGLGLLLCKEFVALQGGEIHYCPNSGGGSVFTVTFKRYTESVI